MSLARRFNAGNRAIVPHSRGATVELRLSRTKGVDYLVFLRDHSPYSPLNRRSATGRSIWPFPALKRRAKLKCRSAAGESNLRIPDKAPDSKGRVADVSNLRIPDKAPDSKGRVADVSNLRIPDKAPDCNYRAADFQNLFQINAAL